MKHAYLTTVDHHYDSPDYYLCATEAAADKLFKKILILRENYFDPEEDTEEDFKACYSWYWESQNTDTVMVLKHQVLTEDEI